VQIYSADPKRAHTGLSSIGDTVMDPFAGSGTTLVEALRLGRNAIGIDANPLSELICRVKSSKISSEEDCEELLEIANEIAGRGHSLSSNQLLLFGDNKLKIEGTHLDDVDQWVRDWFDHVLLRNFL
jgi:hypothetical protein